MAKTMSESFRKFKSNLEITTLQATTVSTRQQHVRDALSDDFKILNSFLSGSYKRSTMVAPLSQCDVDVFMVLDPKYWSVNTPAGLLDKVRAALLKTYTKTPRISRNGQAVTITFTDFQVDVVPAFHRKGGGYLIPDSISGSWISTDPTIHDSALSVSNATHAGDLIPLVKMIKAWNRVINDAFRGFYLELLTDKVLSGVKISSFPSGCRYVFDKGREKVKNTIPDPAGFGSQVSGLAGLSKVSDAVSRFETAYSRALKAEEFESQDKTELAVGEWRKIFGDYFPAYG